MSELDTNEIKSLIMEAPIAEYIGESGAKIFAERVCGVRTIKDSEYLFRQGEIEKNLYILTQGRIAFVKEKTKNDENLPFC